MKQIKYSRQREAIKSYLMTRKDHPTADAVYLAIREEYPNISLGTVYRNLSLLADMGEVLKFSCDGRVDHFDADTHPHYHFNCRGCGAVVDLMLPEQTELNCIAAEGYEGRIEGHQLVFYGQCAECMKTEEKQH